MRWFQRYGLPGGYFLLFFFLWMLVFYPCRITEINNDGVINFVGITAISFIPIGYCLSILAQLIYLVIPKIGTVGRAINQTEIFTDDSKNNLKKEYLKEVYSLLYVIENVKNKIEQQNMLKNWIANRNDILTINFSLCLATITVPLLAYLGPDTLLGWTFQPNKKGILFLSILDLVLCLVFIFSYKILSHQNVEIIKGWYNLAANINCSKLIETDKVRKAKEKKDEENEN